MFLGHFAVALAAKKATPKTSLGTLVLAAQFADMLWPLLLLLGIEQVRIVPGLLPVSPFDFTSYPCASAGHADLSRRRKVRPRHVELLAAHDCGGIRAICGGNGGLSKCNSSEGSYGKSGVVVSAWTARCTLPRFYLWTSALESAGARLERSRNVAHCAMGSVGRPASAIKHGEFVNFELTANGLMILVAQTSVCATHCRHENYCIGALKLAGSGDSGGNIVTLTRESPGFTGTTGPPGHPISRVR